MEVQKRRRQRHDVLHAKDEADKMVKVQKDLEDLIPNFLNNRNQDVELATELVLKSDFSALKTLAHAMKGTCMSFGFHDAAEIVANIEAAAKNENGATISGDLSRLKNLFESIEVEFI